MHAIDYDPVVKEIIKHLKTSTTILLTISFCAENGTFAVSKKPDCNKPALKKNKQSFS